MGMIPSIFIHYICLITTFESEECVDRLLRMVTCGMEGKRQGKWMSSNPDIP
jgi:hypothetical protein